MISIGTPFRGHDLVKLKAFLWENGLTYEENIQWTVNFLDLNGDIIATGSLEGNVLKCLLVSPKHRGERLTEKLVTLLTKEGIRRGQRHLLLFTKPGNAQIFKSVGFYEVARTEIVVMMENIQNGIRQHRSIFDTGRNADKVGCLICRSEEIESCSLDLIEEASNRSEILELLVLKNDGQPLIGEFMRREIKNFRNVFVRPAGIYIEVMKNCPTYFLSEKIDINKVYTKLFLRLFYINYALPMGLKIFYINNKQHGLPFAFKRKMFLDYMTARNIEVVEI